MSSKQTIFCVAGQAINLESNPCVWAPSTFARTFGPYLAERCSPGATVLEIGVGSGVLSILAGRLGIGRLVGLDINPEAAALARHNWSLNDLGSVSAEFRSYPLSHLPREEEGGFDLVWSNPPVLPNIGIPIDANQPSHVFELSGPDGRLVLDAVISGSRRLLTARGKLLVIATSLQGWSQTEALLNEHWQSAWKIVGTHSLPLTDECIESYRGWWERRGAEAGETSLYRVGDVWMHDVWFIECGMS